MNVSTKVAAGLLRKLGWFLLLSLPIFLFLWPFLVRDNAILVGDWDYFAQLYEAARKSIVEYNQFPWFNPWIGGGVPLYANPQFGLVSLQMPLIILFGTLTGLRLAVLAYFLVGFWGMRSLLLRLGSDRLYAILLSFIWTFSSFPVWRIAGGHFTFSTYFLAPWFFLLLLNVRLRLGWLWLGLFSAFLLNQSLHYLTIHILMIALALVLYQFFFMRKKYSLSIYQFISPYIWAVLVTVPLIAHKLFFTLQYLHDFPRTPPFQGGVPINVLSAGLTFRGTKIFNPVEFYKGGLGWSEYAAYFGLISLILLSYVLVKNLEKISKIPKSTVLLVGGLLLVFLIALGDFGPLSPYGIMKDLPIFNQMQVPSRWLGWFVFGAIVMLSKLPRKAIFVFLLAFSVLDVFQSSFHTINYDHGKYIPPTKVNSSFTQQSFYKNTPDFSINSLRLLHATQANIGDIYGYEPLVGFAGDINYGYSGLTNRCDGATPDCNFVLSNNAKVLYWSPNYIRLLRTSGGDIVLNINPGSYWRANGVRLFSSSDVVSLKQDFVVKDESSDIALNIDPSLLFQ